MPSNSAISSAVSGLSYSNIYMTVWKTLLQLAVDPHLEVRDLAKYIVNMVKLKVRFLFIILKYIIVFIS